MRGYDSASDLGRIIIRNRTAFFAAHRDRYLVPDRLCVLATLFQSQQVFQGGAGLCHRFHRRVLTDRARQCIA